MEAEEISNIKAGETLIKYQQKYIKIANEMLKLNDEEFAKFAENSDFSQGCIRNYSDSWGWQLPFGNRMELPDCFNLCRKKDGSLADKVTEAYVETAKAQQAKYKRASIVEPEVMISNADYAADKREYISTKLGACEYECELALAEIYIEWLEVYGELLEHDDFDKFKNEVIENVNDAINGKGFWASKEFKEFKDKRSKIANKIRENYNTIYELGWEISQRSRMLR